jgi:hypothetical protein
VEANVQKFQASRNHLVGAALSLFAACALMVLAPACGDDSPAGSGGPAGGAGADAAAGSGGMDAAPDSGSDARVDSGPSYSSCSADGWCWALPDPQGNDLLAAWANSRTDVWLVGVHGTVLHHDGQRWGNATVPTTVALRGVWASGPTDVWAVGDDGVVLRFDGRNWTKPELMLGADGGAFSTDLNAIYGTGPNDVWIVGAGGTIVHWDGASFSNPASKTTSKLNAVWAESKADVWAVGEAGTVVYFDGVEWALQTSSTTAALNAVHGTGDRDVWAVGATIVHYDGTRWSDARAGAQTTTLWEVVAEAPDSVWVFGDGGGVWHREVGSVDAGVDAGVIWQKRSSGTDSSLQGVARLETGKLLSVGMLGTLIYWDGAGRTLLTRGSARNRLAISGSGSTNVWAVGDEIVRFDGTKWFEQKTETARALFGVKSTGPAETWAVGTGGAILRWDDKSPSGTTVATGTSVWLRSIWTDGTGKGWVVGAAGNLFELGDGTLTKATSGTTNDLTDVWAASASAVWAVGARGTIVRYDGMAWAAVTPSVSTAALRGVWGSAANDVWVVGTEGTILHYDGTTWSVAADAEEYSLNDVWGSAADDVYAVGSGGTILHFDGSAWAAQNSGTGIPLNGVWGAGRNDVWVVGENGTILRKLR